MKKIDTIVVAPHFYTMEGAGVGYHSDAAMAVDGGKILKVGNRPEILAEYTAEEMITLDHHMVLPGFIDGHMHTACNIMRGLAQDTNSWMMFGLQPFDNAVNDEERDAGSRVAILEAVRAGTTTLGDYESKMEMCVLSSIRWAPEGILHRRFERLNDGFINRANSMSLMMPWERRA